MYLKKLEIVGFKSFADKTKIEFDQGITAVVGPNGSGKSNIIEALRWVLGEQSAKSLRGGKMPDVIFAGTQKRQAQNMAEVVASFDNQDGYLEGEREVIITRRLYRNGDSDYLINGKKRRLRDIHDLFMDTGTGRDSLSIISQGRVEQIFNAKPEERRAIIEEAAGVLKYKTRKVETESKLKSTQDNLDRLEDIIYELKGQLTPLRAQRDLALKFKDLDQSRQELKLLVILGQIQRDLDRRSQAQHELDQVLQTIGQLEDQETRWKGRLSNLRQERSQLDQKSEDNQKQILSLTELKLSLESRIDKFDLEKKNQDKSSEERKLRLEKLMSRKQEMERKLSDLQTERLALKEEREASKGQLEQVSQVLDRYGDSPSVVLDRLREGYLKVVNQEADLSNQLTKNQAQVEAAKLRAQENGVNRQEALAKLGQTKAVLSQSQMDLQDIKSMIKQLLADFKDQSLASQVLTEQISRETEVQFTILGDLQEKKARLVSLERVRDTYSNLYAGVQAIMKRSMTGTIGVVADLLTFESRYARALEVALGGSSQHIVVKNEQVARESIAYLRENKKGRATFLPLTTIKPRDFRDYERVSQMSGFIDLAANLVHYDQGLENVVSNLLATTVVVEDLIQAQEIAKKMNFSLRLVTLDGSQINPGGAFSGGATRRNSSTFIVNEIAELDREIKEEATRLDDQGKKLAVLQEKQKKLVDYLASRRQEGEDKRLLEREMELKVEGLAQEQEDLQALIDLSQPEPDLTILEQLKGESQAIQAALDQVVLDKRKLEGEEERIRSGASTIQAEKEEKSQELMSLRISLSELKVKEDHLTAEGETLTENLRDLSQEIDQLNVTSDTSLTEDGRQQLVEQFNEVSNQQEASNIQSVSLRIAKEDILAQLDEIELKSETSTKQLQELTSQKVRLSLELDQIGKSLQSYQASLAEDYHLSYEAAQKEAERLEEIPLVQMEGGLEKAEIQLRGLEKRIRALGPINLEAVPQFDQINERYGFLMKQKEDILEAKKRLIVTMTDMDDEVRTRFGKVFSDIRTSFSLTFQQMFGGGVADLELTTDDLLTSGVEIRVQPPGKKLTNFQLMSGGEKALTALALLFAILRVRTVPFVVLDEVEAALDEANVKRFGDYMNNFGASNQFIVVTHRKGTMSAAHAMYGVTMLDAGVSRLVSVKFSEITEKEKN